MKASERLRELDGAEQSAEAAALMRALPLIADVVEAAEMECARKETSDPEKSGIDYWAAQKDHPIPGVQRRIEMARALTALRDALQPPLGSEPLGVEGFRELIEAGDVQTLRERLAEEGSPPPPEGDRT